MQKNTSLRIPAVIKPASIKKGDEFEKLDRKFAFL